MRYVFLNWFSISKKVVQFFFPKQAFILLVVLFSAPLYAATCPAKSELQLQPDGHFATANGWRSQYNHRGLSTAVAVFRSVTLIKDANGETKVSGCVYELRYGRTVQMVMLPPFPSTSAVPEGKNWQKINKSSDIAEYECTAWQSKKPCEFAFSYLGGTASAGANPLKHDHKGGSNLKVEK